MEDKEVREMIEKYQNEEIILAGRELCVDNTYRLSEAAWPRLSYQLLNNPTPITIEDPDPQLPV